MTNRTVTVKAWGALISLWGGSRTPPSLQPAVRTEGPARREASPELNTAFNTQLIQPWNPPQHGSALHFLFLHPHTPPGEKDTSQCESAWVQQDAAFRPARNINPRDRRHGRGAAGRSARLDSNPFPWLSSR